MKRFPYREYWIDLGVPGFVIDAWWALTAFIVNFAVAVLLLSVLARVFK